MTEHGDNGDATRRHQQRHVDRSLRARQLTERAPLPPSNGDRDPEQDCDPRDGKQKQRRQQRRN
ncbi:MAG: hypothetical protein A2W18_00935 [Candidatus Muproteobacteria bacterium RBG_16_60_9]|uniref:Uncharacterized protein n=1 Tax=Candidatus Muproteobacteria bacterium RBG_16_60_9 TaxID=1817755 RepID=A0A1F6UX05_9PROT|nr:MAG: hypothetical protein A2W18_00935 [Candidatus Muproteobacteria bacterium RBG_16_60_9]